MNEYPPGQFALFFIKESLPMVSQLCIQGMRATLPPMIIHKMWMALNKFCVLEHGPHTKSIDAVAGDEHEHENEYAHAARHKRN